MSPRILLSVGWSHAAESGRAGKDAAEMARARLGSRRFQLAVVFGSSWFDQPALLRGVRSCTADAPLIGGSTAGEITPEGPASHSCVVVLLASEALSTTAGLGEQLNDSPREAGRAAAYGAAHDVRATPRLGFLLMADGLSLSYADMMRGIQEVVGTGALIAGGMAGDDLRFSTTWQYFNDHVTKQAVVGVLLAGEGKIGVGIEHGFAPISKPRLITKAKGHILFELDRLPAASVYEEYFGGDVVSRMRGQGLTRQGIAYPLGVQSSAPGEWLLRNVVSLQADGGLSCSGDVPEGGWVQLMIGSKALALEAARRATQQAIRPLNHIAGVLIFESVLRRKLLGQQHAALELAGIRQIIGPSTPLAGCYTYGEQGPLVDSSLLRNRTVTQTGSILVFALGS